VRKRSEDERHRGAIDRRAFLCAAAGTTMLVPHASHAQRSEKAGSVGDVKGDAFVVDRNERRSLAQAAPVFVNDMVGTGEDSRLTMLLGKDTTLRLGSQARLILDRVLVNAGGDITLQSGPILFSRPAGSPPARMRIQSSFGLIAVRGTRFFAGPSNDVFGVFVERGSVSVTAAGRQVVLRAGQGTNIAQPGAAPTPPAPWKPERIRAAFESVD